MVFATPFAGVYGTATSSARHFPKHWHGTYGFGLLDDGAQTSASGRGTVDAYAGQVMTTNPGEVHDGRPLGGPSRRWRMLHLDPEILLDMVMPPGAARRTVELARPVIDDVALREAIVPLFARLHQWSSPRGAFDTAIVLACEEALANACGQLVARHSTLLGANAWPADVTRARDCLADRVADPPPLSELAAMVGLSRFQLVRRFSSSFGMTPYAWLQHQRAERARRLIRSGLRLADAAAASGFADQSHLTRSFTRHFGFTPGAWQQACNQVQDRGAPASR